MKKFYSFLVVLFLLVPSARAKEKGFALGFGLGGGVGITNYFTQVEYFYYSPSFYALYQNRLLGYVNFEFEATYYLTNSFGVQAAFNIQNVYTRILTYFLDYNEGETGETWQISTFLINGIYLFHPKMYLIAGIGIGNLGGRTYEIESWGVEDRREPESYLAARIGLGAHHFFNKHFGLFLNTYITAISREETPVAYFGTHTGLVYEF